MKNSPKQLKHKKIYSFLIYLFFAIGIIFHFYNLNWGDPYYFHPDERQNVAYPILESKSVFLYDQKNFDIGTFPLIVIKLIYPLVGGLLFGLTDPLGQIIVTSRFLTACLSIGAALIIFKIGNDYFKKLTGLISLFIMLFSVANIQYSHFGTVEMWEAFFLTALFYFSLKIANRPTVSFAAAAGIITSVALATKILTLVAIPAVIFSFFTKINKKNKRLVFEKIILCLFYLSFVAGITFILMPHAFLNFQNAYPSLKFESDVTLGKLPVFYTQGFTGTIPFVFQFTNVYPFLINPLFTLMLLPSIVYVCYLALKKKSYAYALTALFFLTVLVFQGHFFAKWTRYYIPSIPFAALLLSILIESIYSYLVKKNFFPNIFLGSTLAICFLYGSAFLFYTYVKTPSQIEAARWAASHIPIDSQIIAEPFDLGIGPFHEVSNKIQFFNFYEIDNDPKLQAQLPTDVDNSKYIVLTSQRILRSRTLNPDKFPFSAFFYKSLENKKKFRKIYQTSCDFFCKLIYLGDPILKVEETASVFDRPIVTIYEKVN